MDELYELSRRTFADLVPDGEQRLDQIFAVAPGLAELAVGVVYGHLYHRPALDHRTREVAALAAIVGSGMVDTPLQVHTNTGLASGLAPAEVVETVIEAAAFSGFPRAVSSLRKIEEVFTARQIPVPPGPAPRELLLDWLCEQDDLPDGEPQVLTIGPDAAVAIFTPELVVHARLEHGRIAEVTRFKPSR